MTLERLAKRTQEATGLAHSDNLFVLRRYIKVTSDEGLIAQIEKMRDSDLIRTLWEAGLSAIVQQAALDQLKEIS